MEKLLHERFGNGKIERLAVAEFVRQCGGIAARCRQGISEFIGDRLAVFRNAHGQIFARRKGHGIDDCVVVNVGRKVHRFVDCKGHFRYVARGVCRGNAVAAFFGKRCAALVVPDKFAVLIEPDGQAAFGNGNGYVAVRGEAVLHALQTEFGRGLVDDERIGRRKAVVVFKGDLIRAVFRQFLPRNIFDDFAVFLDGYDSLVRPSERNVGVRMAAIFHARKHAVRRGLFVGKLRDYRVDARAEFVRQSYEFTVHRVKYAFVERDRVCENGFPVRIAVQVLSLPDRRDVLFPIEVTFYPDGRIFRDDLVQPFFGKVRHFGVGIAGLLVNEVRSVDRVGGVLFVHRDTRIPSRIVPFSRADVAFFADAGKGKRIVVILKRIGVPVLIRCLPIFLLQGLCGYVHGRCRKIAYPDIARSVGAYDVICARVDGVDDCALCVRYAVDRYAFDGREYIRIAVCPSDRNIAVRRAVCNVVERQRLVRAVDDYCVFARGKPRGIFRIEHIFAGLIVFRSRRVRNKFIRAGLLNVNAFQVRIRGFKLDMPRVRIAAAPNGRIVRIELGGGDAAVNGDRVGFRLIAALIPRIE